MILEDRIIEFYKHTGLKQSEFASKAGVTQQMVSALFKSVEGEKNKEAGKKLLVGLASNFPELNAAWLLTGKGDMLISNIGVNEPETVKEKKREVYRLKSDRNIADQSIPLYNIEASAGIVTLFTDTSQQQPVDYIQVPNLPKCDGAVYVTGDSMYPLLKSGDIVMYKQMHDIKNGLIFGEMYLISIDYDGDEIVSVKWLQKSEKGEDWIKLVSENRHHPDRDIELSRVRALALVKAIVRINSMS